MFSNFNACVLNSDTLRTSEMKDTQKWPRFHPNSSSTKRRKTLYD